jgi:hypothetical protein
VDVVDQTVEDAIGDGRIANLLVPAGGQLARVRIIDRVW